MATTAVLPTACPVCGFAFGLVGVAIEQAHYLAHMIVLLTTDAVTSPRDASTDW